MPAELIPSEVIENKIFFIRGKKVMIDRDLAQLYGVPTKRLNEQVKRNPKAVSGGFYVSTDYGGGKSFKVAICDLEKGEKY